MPEPGSDYAAHHMVASGAEKAAEARDILKQHDIDIDSAINGVFLPRKRGISNAVYHPELHTNAYYERVNQLLRNANTKSEVIDVLKYIRQQLLNGTFPY
jgi:hypothetical protein